MMVVLVSSRVESFLKDNSIDLPALRIASFGNSTFITSANTVFKSETILIHVIARNGLIGAHLIRL